MYLQRHGEDQYKVRLKVITWDVYPEYHKNDGPISGRDYALGLVVIDDPTFDQYGKTMNYRFESDIKVFEL